jgi:hypothetical protein
MNRKISGVNGFGHQYEGGSGAVLQRNGVEDQASASYAQPANKTIGTPRLSLRGLKRESLAQSSMIISVVQKQDSRVMTVLKQCLLNPRNGSP